MIANDEHSSLLVKRVGEKKFYVVATGGKKTETYTRRDKTLFFLFELLCFQLPIILSLVGYLKVSGSLPELSATISYLY
jgi:hypothetical protein